jgi:hypothetical protein
MAGWGMITIYVRCIATAVGLMLLTFSAAYAQTATPNPDTILEDCNRTLPADRPIPTGSDAPSIRIISPASGTIIQSDEAKFADVTFTVEITNFDMPESGSADEGNHWHLWLNNSVWGMYVEPSGFNGIPYGKWRICASIGDAAHVDIGMPDAIYLIVEKGTDGQGTVIIEPTPSTIAASAIATTPTPETSPSVSTTPDPAIVTAGIIILGIVAVGVGLWLGVRRGNHPQ